MSKLGTAEDAAKRLNTTKHNALRLAREGVLEAPVTVRCGRRVLFNLDALEQWILNGGSALPGGWRREKAS